MAQPWFWEDLRPVCVEMAGLASKTALDSAYRLLTEGLPTLISLGVQVIQTQHLTLAVPVRNPLPLA